MRLLPPLALVTLLATPAFAQTAETGNVCAGMVESFDFIQTAPESAVEDIADGCRITDAYFTSGALWRFRFEELVFTAVDLTEAFYEGRQYEQATFDAKGLRPAVDTGSPLYNYITEMQSAPFDLHLSYSWDPQTGDTEIADLRFTSAALGDWHLSGRLGAIPNLALARTGAVPFDGTIEELSLSFTDKYIMIGYLAPAMFSTLPYDEPPEPNIAAAKAAFTTAIEALPETSASRNTKTVLAGLVAQFPNPDGRYNLNFRAGEQPVRLSDMLIDTPEGLDALLSRTILEASHEPAPEPISTTGALDIAGMSLPPLDTTPEDAAATAACRSLVKDQPDIGRTATTTISAVPGGCMATDIRFDLDGLVSYSAEQVVLLTPNIVTAFADETIFAEADLSVQGLRIAANTGSPVQDYIMAMNSPGMDLRLSYISDPAARTSTLRQFSITNAELGGFNIRASLSDFDNADFTDFAGYLDSLTLTIQDDGLFVLYAAPLLLALMPPDEDPRPVLAAIQQNLVEKIEAMPALDDETRATLTAFITGFPDPQGSWAVTVNNPEKIALTDMVVDDDAGLIDLLGRLEIHAGR